MTCSWFHHWICWLYILLLNCYFNITSKRKTTCRVSHIYILWSPPHHRNLSHCFNDRFSMIGGYLMTRVTSPCNPIFGMLPPLRKQSRNARCVPAQCLLLSISKRRRRSGFLWWPGKRMEDQRCWFIAGFVEVYITSQKNVFFPTMIHDILPI